MTPGPVRVPAASVMRDVTMTVEVTGLTVWRLRLWLGLQLMRLAARVIGCGIRVVR